MTPEEYERAVAEWLKILYPPPQFEVRHDFRLPGQKSNEPRQIDAAVFEAGAREPFLIVEAKRRKRRIELGIAGATIALVRDVGSIPAVMVSTSGVATAAQRYLTAEGIDHVTLTIPRAKAMLWIPLVMQRFPADRTFREVAGHLVEALRNGDVGPFLDSDIPYEEWLAVMSCGQSLFPESANRLIKQLALEHFDDGVRYNAVLLLDEAGALSSTVVEQVMAREPDPEAQELLASLL